jgi:F-type H+-transporting ATPase subunit b
MAQSTHGETVAQDGRPFPPFQIDTYPSQLFWLVVSFTLLYVLVAKIGIPRIRSIFEDRRRHIADDVEQAQNSKAASEKTLSAYRAELADARHRAADLLNKTRKQLREQTGELRKTVDAQMENYVSSAEMSIADAKAKVVAGLPGIAANAAREIVTQLTAAAHPATGMARAAGDAPKR